MPYRISVALRLWLFAVAGLVFLTVIVGGATRLTESGLSIVEWKPLTGALPPLTEAAWQAEFDKYKSIPQYEILNRGMGLHDFKVIYWWEWGHRNVARLTGMAFLLPFLWFLWRGALSRGLVVGLSAIFALGAVQAGVGWWMVASGLADRIFVSHYRLAFHLTLACVIFSALVFTGARLSARPGEATPWRLRAGAGVLVGLVLAQIYVGALVAGMRAGLVHNTWPLIDGALIPSARDLFFADPVWINFFENTLTIQFTHRMVGYALALVAILHLVDATLSAGGRRGVRLGALALAVAIVVQIAIGVLTLLARVPLDLAILHQGTALVVLLLATLHAERLTRPGPAAAPAPDLVLVVR
ncbi:COX15/CtaA family protein [Rhodoplanes elegans]|uniref:COX15/CtaA family protein n=1 Tax=Rhodoplanes elegans TaxID=29408 RepID=UPI001FDEABA6|nr:COX15/CtaA family protein [Rhodoplanes elegans]